MAAPLANGCSPLDTTNGSNSNDSTQKSSNPNPSTNPDDETVKNNPSESKSESKMESKSDADLLTAGVLKRHEIENFTMNESDIHKHCIPLTWSNCDATSFEVRRGPNYVSGQKAPSKQALYTIFAVDAYTTSRKIHQAWKYVDIQRHIEQYKTPYDKENFPLPPLFILNLMIPNYQPELYGGKSDGEGMSVIVYAHISEDTREQLQKFKKDPKSFPMSPAINLLQQFIHSDLVNSEIRNRFKVIARLMNTKHTDFGFLANRLVSRYNAKPFLARTSSTFHHVEGQYFAADIDVHVFGYPARQGLSYVKGQLQTAIYDLGMTIEGHSNDQLPEQILACCRVSKMGFDSAEPFPEKFMKKFIEEQEAKEAEEQLDDDTQESNGQHAPKRSESTGDLMAKVSPKPETKNGKMKHAQSARNALPAADPNGNEQMESEKKKKGDSGSWSLFGFGQ